MTEKIYLETFEKCPGSVYFPLLMTLAYAFQLVKNLLSGTCFCLTLVLNQQFDFWLSHKNI